MGNFALITQFNSCLRLASHSRSQFAGPTDFMILRYLEQSLNGRPCGVFRRRVGWAGLKVKPFWLVPRGAIRIAPANCYFFRAGLASGNSK